MANKNAIPPEHGKFKPGQTGNPNGRPNGVPNAATRYKRFLELTQHGKNPVTGEAEDLTIAELMDLQQIKRAMGGDLAAYKEILDRLEGKSLQRTENEHNLGEQTAQTILKISFRPPEDEQPIASPVPQKPKGARKKG